MTHADLGLDRALGGTAGSAVVFAGPPLWSRGAEASAIRPSRGLIRALSLIDRTRRRGRRGGAASASAVASPPPTCSTWTGGCRDTPVDADARRALHHLLQRHAVPADRAGRGRAARAARPRRSTFPRRRPAAGRCTATPATSARRSPLARRFVRVFGDAEVVVSPSASCVGDGARAVPAAGRAGRRRAPGRARSRAIIPRVFELSELLVDKLGVEDVGAYFPHRVTFHPTCHSLRLLRVGDAPAAAAARGPRASTSSSCPTPRSAAASAAPSR